MRRYNIPTLAAAIGARGEITTADVETLRANLCNGEEVWPHEARALFALMHMRLPACPQWREFIVEALSHYVVHGLEPHGSVDDKNSRWLAAMMRQGADHWDGCDLALVLAIMEKARGAPLALQHFALELTERVAARRAAGLRANHGASSAAMPCAESDTGQARADNAVHRVGNAA